MTTSLLLVHAPLMGPSTWAALAERAAARSRAVAVPDLTGGADAAPEPVVGLLGEVGEPGDA